MNLSDLVSRPAPRPWSEGDNIPWNDPQFSQRMLKEHLSQDHDAASRRFQTIDRHARFIIARVLPTPPGAPARILDLGCGPGLYAQRLAQAGHAVHGIDFSPASIDYARQFAGNPAGNSAASAGFACAFTLGDIRAVPYPAGNDLVMMIYGEFNVFCPADARAILTKAFAALKPGGRLLLEPHPEDFIRQLGKAPSTWYTAQSGLFSDQPHLMLFEACWDESARVVTNRHILVDAATGEVTRYAASYQAYTTAEYVSLIESCGFSHIEFFPSLTGEEDGSNLIAIVAQK